MSQTVITQADASLISYGTVEELFGLVYDNLNDLVHYLALRYSNDSPEILMDKDELVGELYLELWKGCLYYQPKQLPVNQILSVMKVMLSNRIAELRYRYFRTHRKQGQLNISINITIDGVDLEDRIDNFDPMQSLVTTVGADPADLLESKELVVDVRSRLDPVAQEVFDVYLYGNKQLELHVWLSAMRLGAVNSHNTRIQIRPHHIASALCITELEVKLAIKSIKNIVSEVCYE